MFLLNSWNADDGSLSSPHRLYCCELLLPCITGPGSAQRNFAIGLVVLRLHVFLGGLDEDAYPGWGFKTTECWPSRRARGCREEPPMGPA
jgi:hypothetical protein